MSYIYVEPKVAWYMGYRLEKKDGRWMIYTPAGTWLEENSQQRMGYKTLSGAMRACRAMGKNTE